MTTAVGNDQPFYHDIEQNLDNNVDPHECRQMVTEFLALEKQFGVSGTYNVVGRLFQEQPDMIDWIVEAGQAVAFHYYKIPGLLVMGLEGIPVVVEPNCPQVERRLSA